MNDGVEQQTQRIYKKVALLAFDLLAPIKAELDDVQRNRIIVQELA